MKASRMKKALLNTTTSAVQEFVQLVCGLILPRLILVTYGSAYNGIISSAGRFLSVVSLLAIGIDGATRMALYRPLAENNINKVSEILKATENYLRKVGVVLLVYVAGLAVAYPMFVDTGYSWMEVAPLIIAAGVASSGMYFFGSTYNALIGADQSVYISHIFAMITNILNVVIAVTLIKIGCNIQCVKLCSSVVLLLNPAFRACYIKRKYKILRKCKADASALPMRKHVMAHSIANIIHDSTDFIILTVFCGVKVVSVYTVYNLVVTVLNKIQIIFTSGTEAIFGNMWIKGEIEKIRKNLGYYEFVVSLVVSTVISTTLVMILPFISLYTKGVTDINYILPTYSVVITVAQMFYCFRVPYQTLIQGIGHYQQTKLAAYIEAGINLFLSVILVQFIGITGTAIGTLVANLCRTIWFAVYIEKKIVPRGIMVVFCRFIWAIGNIFIVYVVAYGLVNRYANNNWLLWAVSAMLVLALSIIVSVVSSALFYYNDLKAVFNMVKTTISRKQHNMPRG